jgi:hypothetical protein
MKSIFLIVFFLSLTASVFSQDTIFTHTGQIIPCRILYQDSINVRFSIENNGSKLQTSMNRNNISRIGVTPPLRMLESEVTSIGIGFGWDYGGMGINFQGYVKKTLAITASLGYSGISLGYNAGLKFRKNPEKIASDFIPYGLILYGVNSVIRVTDFPEKNKIFHGPIVGLGTDIRFSNKSLSCLSIGIMIPLKNSRSEQYINDLITYSYNFKSTFIPLGISIGLRLGVRESD